MICKQGLEVEATARSMGEHRRRQDEGRLVAGIAAGGAVTVSALFLVASSHGPCMITAALGRATNPKRMKQEETRVGLLRPQPPAPQGHTCGRRALVLNN